MVKDRMIAHTICFRESKPAYAAGLHSQKRQVDPDADALGQIDRHLGKNHGMESAGQPA